MSIRSRLIIIILSLVAIPLLFVSIITFSNYKNSLTTSRLSQLQNIARFKAEEIDAYFGGLKNTIEMSQGFYNVRRNLPILARSYKSLHNREADIPRKTLDGQLMRMREVLGLADIMLADNNGVIVYVCNPEHSTLDLYKFLGEISPETFGQGSKSVYFSDIFINKMVGNKPEMLATALISDLDGAPAGTIIFEIDMAPLYRLVTDTVGLGLTGEILIGKKSGKDIVYLNPLRHDTSAVLTRSVRIGDTTGLPIQNAVSGKTGIGLSIDYRGKNVVAAWRYIQLFNWGLVAKIDAKEDFAIVTNLQRLLIMVLAVVFLMAGIITFSVAQSISVPIQKLSKGAEIIGSGNLDYTVGMNLKDEIGQLSRSFDKMTHDLKTTLASRDELNREMEIRKRSEEALRTSEAGLKQAQELSHLGNWELDLTNNQLTWSDEIYRIFGLSPQEFGATYEAFLEAIHPEDRAAVDSAYSGSLRENKDSYEIEHRVVRKGSGEVRFVHEKCEHFRDGSGKIVRSVGMVHDITERRQAEEALRESEERFRVIADASPIQISVGREEDGTILFTNPEYDRAFGFAKGELTGHKTPELYNDPAERNKLIKALKEAGSLKNYEIQVKKSDGTPFWVSISINRIRYSGGPALLASSTDISERKRTEEALRLRTEELKTSNEELTFFNRSMADREERMIELKKQINDLSKQLGRPPAYDVDFGEEKA